MTRPPKSKAIARLREVLRVVPALRQLKSGSPEFQKWRRNTQVTITQTFGEKSNHIAEFNNIYFSAPDPFYPNVYKNGLESAESLLESMIEEVEEYWEDENQTPTPPEIHDNERTNTDEVFIIHGRDDGTKQTVARFLESLDLEPVILHEQANQGRTIIEKFEEHAQVGFAVALLTPDDVGSLKDEATNLKPRARQNVIFEFGFFVGHLGRRRVCALIKGNVEIPSDYEGVVYTRLDDSDGWKLKLIQELKSVGFKVDANRAIST